MTTTTQDQILELAAEQRCIDRAHIRASAHNLRAMAALVVPGATALLYEDWHEDGWVFCGVLSSDSTCYEQPRFPPEPTPLSPIGDLLASTSPALDENLQYRRHRFGTLRGAHVFLVNETADLSMLPGLDDEVTAIAQARQAHTRFKNRKVYLYYRCPQCRAWLRLPRNIGEKTVTCGKCGATFKKKA